MTVIVLSPSTDESMFPVAIPSAPVKPTGWSMSSLSFTPVARRNTAWPAMGLPDPSLTVTVIGRPPASTCLVRGFTSTVELLGWTSDSASVWTAPLAPAPPAETANRLVSPIAVTPVASSRAENESPSCAVPPNDTTSNTSRP